MQSTEMSVIGSILMEPAFLGIARGMLSPRMFEDEKLARVFSCALKLAKANLPIDTVTVTDKLGAEYGPLIVECAQSRGAGDSHGRPDSGRNDGQAGRAFEAAI